MNTWGVLVAGGAGTRFGRLKQLEPLSGRRVLDWSIDTLRSVCSGVVVVIPHELVGQIEIPNADRVVAGGVDRSASVRAGLDAVDQEASHVLIHDAARPLASVALASRVLAALADGAVGVVPVIAIGDSLRTTSGRSVDRSGFVAVQTPQGFEIEALRSAHESAPSATDDAGLLDRLGLTVRHVEGEATNLKITEPHDLLVAKVLLGSVDEDAAR